MHERNRGVFCICIAISGCQPASLIIEVLVIGSAALHVGSIGWGGELEKERTCRTGNNLCSDACLSSCVVV